MNNHEIINWLLDGDVSVQYQVHRDLLHSDNNTLTNLKSRIDKECFGKRFLDAQNDNGHWGMRFYQPKWTSTHYTLLDLRHVEINTTPSITKIINIILEENKGTDGGINPAVEVVQSDVCINGMFLYYACYFGVDEKALYSIIDFIISQQMQDGGFNCMSNRSGAIHSSLHSTISLLEGIAEYCTQGYSYRAKELIHIEKQAIEFMLQHKLYKSDKTGNIIRKSFTMLSYPPRWYYDILRALDYLAKRKIPYNVRMQDALDILISKRNKDGIWKVQAKHPGQVHFDMEQTGKPSRWNTLRALRVLNYYSKETHENV